MEINSIMLSKADKQNFNAISLTLQDKSLERLYGVLKVYMQLYQDYKYTILRRSNFYELVFRGESLKGGYF